MSQFKFPPEVRFNEKIQVLYYKAVDLSEMPDYLQFARDRLRFKRRIRPVNSQIGYIFIQYTDVLFKIYWKTLKMDKIYEKLEEIVKAMNDLKELLDIKKRELEIIEAFDARWKMDAAFRRSNFFRQDANMSTMD